MFSILGLGLHQCTMMKQSEKVQPPWVVWACQDPIVSFSEYTCDFNFRFFLLISVFQHPTFNAFVSSTIHHTGMRPRNDHPDRWVSIAFPPIATASQGAPSTDLSMTSISRRHWPGNLGALPWSQVFHDEFVPPWYQLVVSHDESVPTCTNCFTN